MQPEKVEHIKVVEWLKQCTDLPFMHIANERSSSPQHGLQLKRMGVVAGVSDLFLPRGNGKLSGIWVEMKAKGGRLSEAQKKFQADMAAENYATFVAYSAEEAILIIKAFYNIR